MRYAPIVLAAIGIGIVLFVLFVFFLAFFIFPAFYALTP